MRRQICWKEKSAEGTTEVRVTLHAQDIKWQFKRPTGGSKRDPDPTSELWDYDTLPTAEQWDYLEQELRNRYQRGNLVAVDVLANIRKIRQKLAK